MRIIRCFLIRRLHKWFGLVLGLQFLLWSISGAAMALIDHRKVAGDQSIVHVAPSPAPAALLPLDRIVQAVGQPISRLEFRPLHDAWVYAATTSSGIQLVDPVDGRRIVIDDARAQGSGHRVLQWLCARNLRDAGRKAYA